jgi:cation diffusion facilitator CzcD-associated flavoprotein CzcO
MTNDDRLPETNDERAARLRRQFGPDPANWVRPTGTDHDVVVVGGGQAGVGIGFSLRRYGIGRTSVVDAAGPGETGVWTTTARMPTLRTPKIWPEPEYGSPELGFRAWYEHRYGIVAYERLGQIPRRDWAAYVDWITQALRVPVRHRTRLVDITPGRAADHGAPAADHLVLRLRVDGPDGPREVTETTRQLVLANGVDGTGGPRLPAGLAQLPPHLAAHTGHRIDVAALQGRRVAVLGAGASALDAAGAALEAGAAEVHLFTRRPDLIITGSGGLGPQNLGARENYHRRSDAERWRAKVAAARAGRSCTLASVERAAAFAGFRLHLAAPWHAARADGDTVVVEAADGTHVFDFVIAGTGYQYDPGTRPELAGIAGDIARWGDRHRPPADLVDEDLATWPYLGDGYELVERHPGRAPWVGRVRVFSAASALSFGIPVGDAQSLATGIPRLVDAVGRDLFFEDQSRPAPAPPPAKPAESFRPVYEHAIWHPDPDRGRPLVAGPTGGS